MADGETTPPGGAGAPEGTAPDAAAAPAGDAHGAPEGPSGTSADAGAAPDGAGTPAREGRRSARARRAQARVDAIRAQGVDVHPPTWLERTSYKLLRGLFILLAKPMFRLEVHGAEKVPTDGPFVLAPVHRSNLDFILASTVHPGRMRYMGKASIWKSRLLGRFVAMLGAFPVHRGTPDRESLRTCMKVIENGEPLVMFPEGTRRTGDEVTDLYDGPAYVAARAGVPLVPVGIGGSDAAMPIGAKLIRPRKIVLVVGDPIRPPAGEGMGRVPRRVVRELTERLQAEIQALYDEARRLAG